MSPSKVISAPNTYVLVAQANCKKMPQGMVELAQYINSAMKRYRVEPDSLDLPVDSHRNKGAAQRSGPSRPPKDYDAMVRRARKTEVLLDKLDNLPATPVVKKIPSSGTSPDHQQPNPPPLPNLISYSRTLLIELGNRMNMIGWNEIGQIYEESRTDPQVMSIFKQITKEEGEVAETQTQIPPHKKKLSDHFKATQGAPNTPSRPSIPYALAGTSRIRFDKSISIYKGFKLPLKFFLIVLFSNFLSCSQSKILN